MIYQMTKNSIIDVHTFACRMIHQQGNRTDTAVYVSFLSSKGSLKYKKKDVYSMRDFKVMKIVKNLF